MPREGRALKAEFPLNVTLRLNRGAVVEETAFFIIYHKHIERPEDERKVNAD